MKKRLFTPRSLVSLALVLTLLISALVCASTAFAAEMEEEEELADTGATAYYLRGLNTNDPDFGAMSSPTGTFLYDGTKGYYYYDVNSFQGGDYCFVVSEVRVSGAAAVRSPAVSSVADGGTYYLTQGSYRGYNCMHIWNPKAEAVRIYFKTTGSGLYAVPLSSVDQTPTSAPVTQKPTAPPATQKPTAPPATQKPTAAPVTQPPATASPTASPADPTSAPATQPPSSSKLIYCENEANWSTVYVYMWNGNGSVQNAAWPGERMKSIGGKIWQFELSKTYDNIIFNGGQGQDQSADLVFPGAGYIWNNATKEWSIYDTSPLQVSEFTTDLASPQYAGVSIVLTAKASGSGDVYYKFSATNNQTNITSLLSDYSSRAYAAWTPATVGDYTLTYEFRDAAGNTNKRTLAYHVDDGITAVEPYIKTVTPSSGQILRNKVCNVSASAGGGITGTRLLFYKYTVQDSSGATVNTPYYTRNTGYSFTPTKLGTYTLTVSVQASDNSETARIYTLDCVDKITDDTPALSVASLTSGGSATIGGSVRITAAAAGGAAPYTYQFLIDGSVVQNYSSANSYLFRLSAAGSYNVTVNISDANGGFATRSITVTASSGSGETRTLKGDADKDGKVTITDATMIQRYLADLASDADINKANADVSGDNRVTIVDATTIQRYLADLETDW